MVTSLTAGLPVGVTEVSSRSKLFTVTGEPEAQPATEAIVVQEVRFVPLVVVPSEVFASLSRKVYAHCAPLPGAAVVLAKTAWICRLPPICWASDSVGWKLSVDLPVSTK